MAVLSLAERPGRTWRAIGIGLATGGMLMWSGIAAAAPAPDGFSELAKKVTPAVVNIASIHEISGDQEGASGLPFDFPQGSPFEKFFKEFRNRMGQGKNGEGQPHVAAALGSGFIIDPAGYVVTNNHVIDGADEVKVRLNDDSVYPAKIVGRDPQTDLALLKIDAKRKLPSVSFGNSDKAEVGDWVMAVGNPFGLGGTVTAGIVSARGRNIQSGPYDDFLQIDAPINRGNSGGPLFDLDGKVIGINSAIVSPNGGSVGIGFAIPSNLAKTVIAQLRETGKVERGWLGVQIQKVTPEIASAIGLPDDKGALVAETTDNSPAAHAGIKQGDVITDFDGHKVTDPRDLALTVAKTPVGTHTTVTVWRDHAKKDLTVIAGEKPNHPEVASATPEGAFHSKALNADLAALTPDKRAQYGIADDVKGVLVEHVKEGSVFELGLRPGDVIEQVGGTAVTTPHQVQSLIAKAKENDAKSVLLLIKRDNQNLFLGLKLNVA